MTEIIKIELTEEQEADRAAQHAAWLSQQESLASRAAAKEAALAKLAKLGLTEEEVAALLN